uniref:Putative LuxR family transcriptional regulator n=1 Tax=Magnetococcus massalia (strain MO-1) TaxID=451514 RepID=A0A1S7LNL8_MAGMO|nr:putative LuxR family transcriptional regulator [Candidatus Magnetococcus massalia]
MNLRLFTLPTLQADLFLVQLQKLLDRPCTLSTTDPLEQLERENQANGVIWLWDWQQPAQQALFFSRLEKQQGIIPLIILINLPNDQQLELKALQAGIRGVLHYGDTLDQLPRALQAVEQGELWFSRQTLTQGLLGQMTLPTEKTTNNGLPQGITPREKEILLQIGAGLSNKQIASKLDISLHTVKVHTYNLYRKIEVSNRMEAAHWAEMNL